MVPRYTSTAASTSDVGYGMAWCRVARRLANVKYTLPTRALDVVRVRREFLLTEQ